MTRKHTKLLASLLVVALAGCAAQGQNNYSSLDVGHPIQVEFGTIVQSREISIQELNTGTGAAIGMGGGALAGAAIGHSLGGLLVGALVGGVAGAVAENAADNHGGYEYTVTLRSGQTVTLAQNRGDDAMLSPGLRCMVQLNGRYSRVLAADRLPAQIARPVPIQVTDTSTPE